MRNRPLSTARIMVAHQVIRITPSNHTELRRPMRITWLEGQKSPGAKSGRGGETTNN